MLMPTQDTISMRPLSLKTGLKTSPLNSVALMPSFRRGGLPRASPYSAFALPCYARRHPAQPLPLSMMAPVGQTSAARRADWRRASAMGLSNGTPAAT